jgi:tetratricopeptide (TPR) repeat protein
MEKYLDSIANVVKQQWKVLAAVVGTALVLLVILGFWKDAQARRDRDATNMLYDAQSSARKAMEQKKPEDAEKAYEPLLTKYKGTRAGYEARLHLGDVWMEAGDFEKASAHYQQAVESSSDPFSRLLALYTLGVARESAGKFQEAVTAYEEALKAQGSDFLRPEVMMAQARCYEALQQPAKAIELYKSVQEKFASRSYYSGAASAYEKLLSATPKQM